MSTTSRTPTSTSQVDEHPRPTGGDSHAVEWTAPATTALARRAGADAGSGQVVVKVTSVGICGTDLNAWHGRDRRVTSGTVLGHEFGGVITAVGPGVVDRRPGDQVAVDPNLLCGTCEACRDGSRGACPERRLMGIDLDGGMQEHVSVRVDQTVPAAPGTDPRALGLVEPLAVAVHACRRAGVSPGDSVVVIGGGAIGMGAALFASVSGATTVTVVEPDQLRLEVARQRGHRAVEPGLAPRGAADVVVDTVGRRSTLYEATLLLRRGGTVCVVGLSHDDSMPPPDDLVRRELTVTGSFCYDRADLETAAAVVDERGLDAIPVDLVDGLEQAPDAFATLAAGDRGSGKTLIVP